MGDNPSLVAVLRVGCAVLLALFLVVALIGVQRLSESSNRFQDETQVLAELNREANRNSAFALGEITGGAQSPALSASPAELEALTAVAALSRERISELAAGSRGLERAGRLLRNSVAQWLSQIGTPLLNGDQVSDRQNRKLAEKVLADASALAAVTNAETRMANTRSRDDTRTTTLIIGVGLTGALLAAILLFSGLINSMRSPLVRLVDGARKLTAGELNARVKVGGPREIATLVRAFNDMAASLESSQRERERIERMRDDLLVTVSHELRTPVTVVKGFAEMLKEQDADLNDGQREALEVITQSAGQLQTMIRDLLDLARSDTGQLRIEPEKTSARAIVEQTIRQMRPRFEEKDQQLTVEIEPGMPRVMADPGRVGQVLGNLLTNANSYAPENAQVEVVAQRVNGVVEFSVADDGPGLSAAALPRVFDRFWRAESGDRQTAGGTGIGLAISKSLIELHGGTISAESRPEGGTKFTFTLPIQAQHPAEKAAR